MSKLRTTINKLSIEESHQAITAVLTNFRQEVAQAIADEKLIEISASKDSTYADSLGPRTLAKFTAYRDLDRNTRNKLLNKTKQVNKALRESLAVIESQCVQLNLVKTIMLALDQQICGIGAQPYTALARSLKKTGSLLKRVADAVTEPELLHKLQVQLSEQEKFFQEQLQSLESLLMQEIEKSKENLIVLVKEKPQDVKGQLSELLEAKKRLQDYISREQEQARTWEKRATMARSQSNEGLASQAEQFQHQHQFLGENVSKYLNIIESAISLVNP